VSGVVSAGIRRGTSGRTATRAARGHPHEGREPWGRRDVVLLALLAGTSIAGLVVTWVGISGTVSLARQARWLGLGIGSDILAGLGMVAWLATGLARVARLRAQVTAVLETGRTKISEDQSASPVPEFGIATGMRRHHRAGCTLLAGKSVRWLDAEALSVAGTLPCGICRPDHNARGERSEAGA